MDKLLLLLLVLHVTAATSFIRPTNGNVFHGRRDDQKISTPTALWCENGPTHEAQQQQQEPRIVITESEWKGAGFPRNDLEPENLPTLLMEALSLNDFPSIDAGLRSMWAFAGDTTRHIFQHNETDYIESAHETANSFPTSFYGNAFYGKSWKMLTPLNRVGGDQGWIATQVMETISSDGRLRRWQWEIRKNRRPPNLNCWYVETIGSSDRKGEFEPE